MKKISIIVPAYNIEPYIKECLDSIFSQDYKNLEVIVIDGGSKDRTLKKIGEYKKDYKRTLKIISQDKKLGVADARNAGARESEGEFIVFLDGDDVLAENSLQKRLERFEGDKNMGIVFSDAFLIKNEKKTQEKYLSSRKSDFSKGLFHALIEENPVVTSSVMIKKEALNKAGLFDTSPENKSEDLDLWVRVSLTGYGYEFLEEPLVYYRKRKGSLSENKIPMLNGRLYVFKKLLESSLSEGKKEIVRKKEKEILSEIDREANLLETKNNLEKGNFRKAKESFREVLKKDPSLRNYAIMFILSFSPGILRKIYFNKNEK